MKKRWLSLMLALCMVLTLLPMSAFADGSCGENVRWTMGSAGRLIISGTGDMTDFEQKQSPFYRGEKIRSVEIQPGVTSIGNNTFRFCRYMQTIDIPDGLTRIGISAFYDCQRLYNVDIPNSVTSIGGWAFWCCYALQSIKIPDGVTSIGNSTFLGCESLSFITIPNSVTTIEATAFGGCTRLTDVYYSGSERQWKQITISRDNEYLTNATIHYNSTGPDNHDPEPTSEPTSEPSTEPSAEPSFYFMEQPNSSSPASKFLPYAILGGEPAVVGGYVEYSDIMDDSTAFSKISWEISDPSVAEIESSIYQSGIMTGMSSLYWVLRIKGLKPGTVTITGRTDDGREATSEDITVEPKITAVGSSEAISGKTKITLCKAEMPSADQDFLAQFMTTITANADGSRLLLGDVTYGLSADGKTGIMDCKVTPKAAGDLTYTVTSPGGQRVTGTIKSNYYNELIYRAAYLNTNKTPAQTLQNTLSRSTPSDLLTESGDQNNLDSSLAVWKGMSLVLDAYDDPTSVAETIIEPKDVYSGLIMSVLGASISTDMLNDMYEDALESLNDLNDFCVDFMQETHKINIIDPKSFSSLTTAQRLELSDQIESWFNTQHADLHTCSVIFENLDYITKTVGSLEDFYDLMISYITVATMSDYMQAALQQAYIESQKLGDSNLQAAFRECMNAINGDLLSTIISNGGFVLGKLPANYIFKEFVWNGVKKGLNPAVTFIMTAASGAKKFTNFVYATDDIQDAYYNLQAVRQVEAVFKAAHQSLQAAFTSSKSDKTAGTYLSGLELAYNAMDVDCDQAYDFVDTVDNALISKLTKLFSGSNLDEQKQDIRRIQSNYREIYDFGTSYWLDELANGYNPFTDEYDHTYEPKSSTSGTAPLRQVNVACPVDVYVYDTAGNLAASVVGGILKCEDENLTVARMGDEKTVRFFDNAPYRVECTGTDSGSMDITIHEFDDAETVTRTVEYSNVALATGKQYSLNKTAANESYELVEASSNQTVQPTFDIETAQSYILSMKGGTFSYGGNIALQGEIPAGATVSVTTETPEGYTFEGWQSSNGKNLFENSNDLSTTFVMPEENVTVQAVFRAETIVASGTCGENLTWTLDSNGLLTINGTGPMANYEYNDNEAPFYSRRYSIKSVIIEPGLTSIGEHAFEGCEKITELSIPDGVTAIKKYAMLGCSALTSVTIPESVTSIERSSFSYCRSLTSITIPNSVTSIGESVFDNCSSLTSVTIPDSVTSIGNDLFYGCSGLTEITIPDSVTSIGFGAFTSCSSLTSVTIPDSVTSIGGYAFNNCSSLTSVTIPNGVTGIGAYIFNNCSSLTSVTIPDSVTSIGEAAFRYCSSLTSVTIPNNVTSIGGYAFNNCSSLTSVTIPNSVTSIGGSAFSNCSSLTSVTIPNGVTGIGTYMFNNCSSLTSVTIPDSVTSIGKNSFYGCSSLTSVTIPNNVTSIGERAFASCSNLTSVTIPNSVTSIESDAFYDCSSLTSVTIPGSVTSIGKTAFGSCDRLVKINVESNNNYYSSLDGVLFNKNRTTLLCCPGSKTVYEIPSSVTSIGYYAFYDCSSLTSVTIPNSVTSIGNNAFYVCSSLTSVSIPDSVTSIGDYAFCDCSSLTSVTIPDSVTSIGDYAFCDCSSLTSVTIPDSVTSIRNGAFEDCSNLTDVYYNGTQEQWNRISIRAYNDPLLNATIHYIPKDNPFADVPDGKYYTDAVLWAVAHDPQITNGYADGTFRPDQVCTRAQVVTFLWRAAGEPEPKIALNPFKDVSKSAYYYKAVLWAVENGITTGRTSNLFDPTGECTRAHVVTFLWRANGSPNPTSTSNPFTDVPTGKYYAKAVLWALENGVTTGKTPTTFNPDGECTRAHVVTFLYRDMA